MSGMGRPAREVPKMGYPCHHCHEHEAQGDEFCSRECAEAASAAARDALCPCGKNERPIAPKSNATRGYVKGERKRFCSAACALRFMPRDEHGRTRATA